MFGIGGTELAIILIFAFLIFGPDKLPAIAKTVGQAIAKFRDVQNEMNQVVKEEVYDPDRDQDNPFQRPLDKMANLDKREVKTETFAERKARHDRERAERQAAMAAQAQKTADAAASPAASANAADGATVSAAATVAAATVATVAAAPKPEPAAKPRPKVSAAELYGTAPRKKAAPKAASSAAGEASEKPAAKPAPSAASSTASASEKPASAGTPEGGE